jgi:hypothetical protein
MLMDDGIMSPLERASREGLDYDDQVRQGAKKVEQPQPGPGPQAPGMKPVQAPPTAGAASGEVQEAWTDEAREKSAETRAANAKGEGGSGDVQKVERLSGSLRSMMKVTSTSSGREGLANSQTNHEVSISGKSIATIIEVNKTNHITEGGGTTKVVTVKSASGKPILGAYKSVEDAKHALANRLATKSLAKKDIKPVQESIHPLVDACGVRWRDYP